METRSLSERTPLPLRNAPEALEVPCPNQKHSAAYKPKNIPGTILIEEPIPPAPVNPPPIIEPIPPAPADPPPAEPIPPAPADCFLTFPPNPKLEETFRETRKRLSQRERHSV